MSIRKLIRYGRQELTPEQWAELSPDEPKITRSVISRELRIGPLAFCANRYGRGLRQFAILLTLGKS